MQPDLFIVDDRHPEDMAMLQALYSRSPASVVAHLEKLESVGSGKFMDQYYVGYGHASIGDCGQTVCFIEQVSMLVAKAVQENPLYNGQEASTRYLDYSKQAVIDPYGQAASTAIQTRWMEIYNDTLAKLIEGLKAAHPFDPAVYKSEKVWQNTLSARAFDIGRSLLPLGTTTLLSWSTSLRQARDNLRRLKHHPLEEVRGVAQGLYAKLLEKYPNSFRTEDMAGTQTPRETYAQENALRTHYQTQNDIQARFKLTGEEQKNLRDGALIVRREGLDLEGLRAQERDVLSSRPQGAALPWRLESYGKYNFVFLLDYGSFRDIQRHRNGVCQIPLLEGTYGLHPWYLGQFKSLLSAADERALLSAIAVQMNAIAALEEAGVAVSAAQNQYLYPMGMQALVHVSYSAGETAYVGELRSGKTVHGSLRPIAQKMLQTLAADLPFMALYGDHDVDNWTAKRGEQTIAKKAG